MGRFDLPAHATAVTGTEEAGVWPHDVTLAAGTTADTRSGIAYSAKKLVSIRAHSWLQKPWL